VDDEERMKRKKQNANIAYKRENKIFQGVGVGPNK
jgi:hypothetical protein